MNARPSATISKLNWKSALTLPSPLREKDKSEGDIIGFNDKCFLIITNHIYNDLAKMAREI